MPPSLVPARSSTARPNQIGVIELIRGGRRQAFARHIKIEVAQALGGGAVGNALEAGDQEILGGPKRLDFKAAHAVGSLKRSIARDRPRLRRERPQLHLAAGAVRGADPADADARRRHAGCRSTRRRSGRVLRRRSGGFFRCGRGRGGGFGGSLGAGLAFLARQCPLGVVARGAFADAGRSRKRSTRSDGAAPLSSQLFAFSMSNFRRSALSLASSGLK